MAVNLNKVLIMGHLGRDPEVRYTKDRTAVANLSVATSESWNDRSGQRQERTEWHRVVVWGRQAELAADSLRKGSPVFVEGRLETRRWQDQSGNERFTTEIRALNMQLIERGSGRRDAADESRGPRQERGDAADRGPERGDAADRGPERGDAADRGPERGSDGGASGPPDDDYGPPPDEDDVPF